MSLRPILSAALLAPTRAAGLVLFTGARTASGGGGGPCTCGTPKV